MHSPLYAMKNEMGVIFPIKGVRLFTGLTPGPLPFVMGPGVREHVIAVVSATKP